MELFAGLDLGGTSVKMGLVDRQGRILARETLELEARAPYSRIMDGLTGGLQALCERERAAVSAIGLCCPGFIEAGRGRIAEGVRNIPALEGTDVAEPFLRAFGVPVFVDNDATCAAAGELKFGAGRSYRHFVLLTLGAGIGGGLVLDGQVYRGASGFAGEIGHFPVERRGAWCNCGSRGCLEQYASGPAILRAYRERREKRGLPDRQDLTVRELFALAAGGDDLAAGVIDDAACAVATVLGAVINLLNPQACLLGGGISEAGPALVEPVRRHLPDFAWPLPSKNVDILTCSLRNDAGLLGAAAQALERLELEG